MKHTTSRIALRLCVLLSTWALLTAPQASAEGNHHAGLVIVYGADSVFSSCVSFGEAALTGAELLQRAGLRVLVSAAPGVGTAICKINDVGCSFPGEQCFCQCLGSPCIYWNYWTWQNGDWVYSGRGAGNRAVRDGDLDAWVWGDGNTRPPAVPLGSLCVSTAATAARPAPSPTPSHTPAATGTPTATASSTRGVSATAQPVSETATAQRTATVATAAVASATAPRVPTETPTATVATATPNPGAAALAKPGARPGGEATPLPPGSVGGDALVRYGSLAVLLVALLLPIGYAAFRKRRRDLRA